jgi:hypothetical protein
MVPFEEYLRLDASAFDSPAIHPQITRNALLAPTSFCVDTKGVGIQRVKSSPRISFALLSLSASIRRFLE